MAGNSHIEIVAVCDVGLSFKKIYKFEAFG